jgi:cytochrome c-type biogenesis protein
MLYFISFLEGIVTFISPCLLPLLPVYISWFAGGGQEEGPKQTVVGALGFISGFTLVFVALGAFAGLLGGLLWRYQTAVNLVTGAIVVVFGLNYMGVLNIRLLSQVRAGGGVVVTGFLSAMLFGMVFSVSWTPCVGAFLGSALMLASQQGSISQGILMLLCFSMGLGVPFLLSALLIEKLRAAFAWLKKHYRIINAASGIFLIVFGLLMMSGMIGRFLAFFTNMAGG